MAFGWEVCVVPRLVSIPCSSCGLRALCRIKIWVLLRDGVADGARAGLEAPDKSTPLSKGYTVAAELLAHPAGKGATKVDGDQKMSQTSRETLVPLRVLTQRARRFKISSRDTK